MISNFLIKKGLKKGTYKKEYESLTCDWKNEKPHGKITHNFYDSSRNIILTYEGDYIEENEVSGGVLYYRDMHYVGSITKINGTYLKHGEGHLYISLSNELYMCDWQYDKIQGVGKLIKDKITYEFEFDERLKIKNSGKILYENGIIFEGIIKGEFLEGKITFPNGKIFEGKAMDPFNLVHGTYKEQNTKIKSIYGFFPNNVTVEYHNKTTYHGNTKGFALIGYFIDLNGNKVSGNWSNKDDKKVEYTNGDIYEGSIENNPCPIKNGLTEWIKKGKGTLTTKNSIINCIWDGDIKFGRGTEKFLNLVQENPGNQVQVQENPANLVQVLRNPENLVQGNLDHVQENQENPANLVQVLRNPENLVPETQLNLSGCVHYCTWINDVKTGEGFLENDGIIIKVEWILGEMVIINENDEKVNKGKMIKCPTCRKYVIFKFEDIIILPCDINEKNICGICMENPVNLILPKCRHTFCNLCVEILCSK